ncbi:MAG: hypothetical protein IJ188_03085 [Clostridia bacterium]|nr:hypothetical protein [Clostridia bacterium]
MRKLFAWLSSWEAPQGGLYSDTQLVPAENARGYQYYPKAVPLAQPKEKADFSRAPQLAWWLNEDKKAPASVGRSRA